MSNSLYLAWKYAWMFVCKKRRSRFLQQAIYSKKQTFSESVAPGELWAFKKQIISNDKFPSIFLHQMQAISVHYPSSNTVKKITWFWLVKKECSFHVTLVEIWKYVRVQLCETPKQITIKISKLVQKHSKTNDGHQRYFEAGQSSPEAFKK